MNQRKSLHDDVEDSSRVLYNDWHNRLAVDTDTNSPWHRLVKKHLEPSRDLRKKRVLEIGCGRGGFTVWLAHHSHRPSQIVAADFSITAIQKGQAFASQRIGAGISWEVGDIQSIPHSDSSFDTVVSCETIEHVPNPYRALSELARVLKPGGRLFLTAPNYLNTLGLYRIYLRLRGRVYTEVGQPINHFTMLPLTLAWVRRAGLRVQTVDAVGHYLPFPGRPPINIPVFNNPRVLMRWLALHSLTVAEKP